MIIPENAGKEMRAKIKVIGVGGGGGNAINTMIEQNLQGVEFIAANTDVQALERNLAPIKIQLGDGITKGLGAGGIPEKARNAALESQERIDEVLEGSDMVFITAGMGGGTGTGAAPIIADIARAKNILTVGVVTKPFRFEKRRRMEYALQGIAEMKEAVDTLIVIPNQKLLELADDDMPIMDAFKLVDQVLYDAVSGISDIITYSGHINVDFADVKTIMENKGMALMGIGTARGEDRAVKAMEAAINNPLIENASIEGAKGLLVNIQGPQDMGIREVDRALTLVYDLVPDDATVIYGHRIAQEMHEEVKITVIATGFGQEETRHIQQESNSVREEKVVRPTVPAQLEINTDVMNRITSPDKPVVRQGNIDAPAYLRFRSGRDD